MATILDVITAMATVVIAIGVPVGFFQVRNAARSERYERYVSRYEEIVTHLPYGVLGGVTDDVRLDDRERTWLAAYIDLCSEELFDYLRGAVGWKVWNDWEKYIVSAFNRSEVLADEFKKYNDEDYKSLKFLVREKKAPPRLSAWERLRAT